VSASAKTLEALLLTLLAATAAALLPLKAGYLGWSWDALNHHIYLGLTAEQPRWHLDVIAASDQTYQYPYLYWPVYRMSLLTGSAVTVAALWAAFQASMLALPVWCLCDRLLPPTRNAVESALLRLAGCTAAAMSPLVISMMQSTANDLLAAVPLLWALVLSLATPFNDRRAACAAALCGVATAFKLSNALFLPWLLLWWWVPERPHWRWPRAAALLGGVLVGFTLAYGAWGWQLWQQTGNPFHPFLAAWFGRR
jgi:hypothetical protein